MSSAPTNPTLPEASCKDIDHCRTLAGLVQSCLVTILACVWFAVHRNIPEPKVDRPRSGSALRRAFLFAWHKVLDQRQAANVFVVALLVPEWVLAWALRQWLVARGLAAQLENARAAAIEERAGTTPQTQNVEKDDIDSDALVASSGISTHSAHAQFVEQQSRLVNRVASRRCKRQCEDCGLHCSVDEVYQSEFDQVAMAKRVGTADEAWEIVHAFFIIMGGYNFCGEEGPLHPLTPKNAVELVGRGRLVRPTSEELANQSKGDALSKAVAIVQTLWFVMQCIARRIDRLPITNLEVMTLAYTVMTVAMYVVWWDKPLNISCAVRVPEEPVEGERSDEHGSAWGRIWVYVVGWQDLYVDLRKCTRVPTFWAADRADAAIPADAIALVVAMVFGAVHCIAWSYTFQSHLEQQLWRASAIAIIAIPAALAVGAMVALVLDNQTSIEFESSLTACYVPLTLIYITARIILILISFTSLRMLPTAAYQTVEWTTFVPHI
ncbi:hypothetical protein HWV62_10833 [Athelia sp. TMB]|nr:hypothetical protein HWV62_10833 [Athelia sp. TMB]